MNTPLRQDRLLIVSGLSGAGKSSTMKTLEDLGYDVVDNLPLSMAWQLAGDWATTQRPAVAGPQGLAIGVDSRTREFSPERLTEFVTWLRARGDMAVELLFLDCDDELLFRRFTETRRRHPMGPSGQRLRDAVTAERAAMNSVRDQAEHVIDTTALSTHDLRALITGYYALSASGLAISIVSFSYRRGVPREADLVFDVRFLKNPHYVTELRSYSGRNKDVGAFISSDAQFAPALEAFGKLVHALMDGYTREGKSYLTIAVGCTGGRHRSVFFAERLGEFLRQAGHGAEVRHRDMGADGGN
ncbi:MAG: RNase adapter RapZ [Alphaproteobacteria bacterium]